MELTIDQALQQGVAAHREGKLQDAERLYRAILQAQPKHPDANHNLGVLAVAVGKPLGAIPLFKLALEANSKIEQFWLSYVDALIRLERFEEAKRVIVEGEEAGVSSEKLDALKQRLQAIPVNDTNKAAKRLPFPAKSKAHSNSSSATPSQEQINHLRGHYQAGRFAEAELLATSLTQQFPKHPLGWRVLSVVLKQTGRLRESLAPMESALKLSPNDAEAHYNLGVTLKDLGRLDEAEASYRQAIALKPDFADTHNNLGNTLTELGRLKEAEASLRQAIVLRPENADFHHNLGAAVQELGKLAEAEVIFKQAIALKPDHADAHNSLADTQQQLGRLEEALTSLRQAIALRPEDSRALLNLSTVLSYMNDLEAETISLQNVIEIDADNLGLIAGVNLALRNFLKGDFESSKENLSAATKIQKKTSPEFKNERVYWRYLSDILMWHEKNYLVNRRQENDKNLYVLGESHSLSSHHLRIHISGIDFFCSAILIKGCKQWHLGNAFRNKYKHQFESIFCALPKHSYVLLPIGEIDCRLETGIIAHNNKFPEKPVREIVLATIENYLIYIINNNFHCQHNIIIQGVPSPNIDVRKQSQEDIKRLAKVIALFNYELKTQSEDKGFKFLDTHQLTNKGDGLSNGCWHLDEYHLSPEGMQEAWRTYTS